MTDIEYNLAQWQELKKDQVKFNKLMNEIFSWRHKGPDYTVLIEKFDLSVLDNNINFGDSHELFSIEDQKTENFSHDVYKKNFIQKATGNKQTEQYLQQRFDLRYVDAPIHEQSPGNYVAPHYDLYGHFMKNCPDYFNTNRLKRYAVFLTKWEIGQSFMLGRSAFTNWTPGDIIEFPWYMPHSTVNLSKSPRRYINVVGLAN
jgi:hypothetical protein